MTPFITMTRLRDDQPEPGQERARRGIRVACTGIRDRGVSFRIEWVPGHVGVPGNELADCWSVDEARRAVRGSVPRPGGNMQRNRRDRVSLAFLKAQRKVETVREWREEIIRRGQGCRSFRVPAVGEIPRIPVELRSAPKELASLSFSWLLVTR